MCEKNNSSSGLMAGLAIGAIVGAGATLLFGTKKGKEIRKKLKDEYPELFDTLGETFENFQGEVKKVSSIKPRLFKGLRRKK